VIAQISKKTDKNTLILVNSLQQGEILFKLLSGFLPEKSVYYIRGEVPNSEREEIRQLMEKKDNVVCIAMSKIFSTGVNVRNLHYIIFALTGKAKIRFLQSIGRGLRLHENKDRLELFDIVDELHYSLKHYEGKRIELYEKEKITYEIKHLSEQ
jgi:superfamily II DNA or RNA helicase